MQSDGYSLNNYGAMIRDERRFRPYLEALRRHVTPDSVVLDIGAGPGIFSFIAAQCGARRVYAVEPDVSIEVARACAAQVPGGDRITFIQDLSTRITLPEKADLVVGDLRGMLPFHTGNIPSLADARQRHLKPGGRMLPQRDLLYLAPATAPEEYTSIEQPWRQNPMGLDLSAAIPSLVNTMWRARKDPIAAERFLAPPALWGIIDYRDTVTEQLDNKIEWTVGSSGTLHGYYLWFDGEIDDGLGFSNSPLLPELVYARCFVPLESPIDAIEGDMIRARFTVKRVQAKFIYRWDTVIENRNGQQKASFHQSTFKLQPGQHQLLQKANLAYVPGLNDTGRMERFILERMGTGASLQEISGELAQNFPAAHPSLESALSAVTRLSQRYG